MDLERGAGAPASGGILEGEGTNVVRKKLRLMGEIEGTRCMGSGDGEGHPSMNGDK